VSYSPDPGQRRTSYFVHPFSPEASHEYTIFGVTAPTSGTNSNIISYTSIMVPSICRVYRHFWANGGTVGTDSVQAGIYEDTAGGPGSILNASPATVSAGANACQFVDATSATGHVVTAANSSTDGTSFTTASVTLKKDRLYTLFFVNSKASAADTASSIDNGPTFVSRQSFQFNTGTTHRSSLWTAVPTQNYIGTLVINFGANTQTGCAWILMEWLNVDTTTNHGIVQTATGTGNDTTPIATLSTLGAANNPVVGFESNAAANAHTPGSGFLELWDQNYATPSTNAALEIGYNDTTVDSTISSAQWGMLAAEIKSKYGPNDGFVLNPGRYWLAWMANGTTTTILRSSTVATSSRHIAGYIETRSVNTGTWLPATATPASPAGVARTIPLCGFTTIASP